MGWLNNGSSDPEGDQTSESSRSSSPNDHAVNSKTATNAQLVSNFSTMEAAHLDQLHELTSQMKEESETKEMELQQAQNRVTAVERRIRERDAQMTALRDEKAGSLRQITDLKNQLYQLQFEVEETTSDKATDAHKYQTQLNESRRDLLESKRALDSALQSEAVAVSTVSALEQENNALKKQLQTNQGSRESEVFRLHQQLAELQSTNAGLSTQVAEEKANTTKNKQLNSKEISNLRSMLRARDDAIQSLQGRVEKGQEEMTALEAEVDKHREYKEKTSGERENATHKLQQESEEMSKLIASQSKALKDMTAKWDKQKNEYEQQSLLAERRGEEIKLLQSALEEGELEKEASIVRSNSLSEHSRTRVTSLEVELQTMSEKVDELTSALNDAMEEIDDLQADVVFKEGQITSLENEMEQGFSLLKARADQGMQSHRSLHSQCRKESDKFARLRAEIVTVTRERAQLESDHALQLSLLKRSKECDISKLEKDLDDVRSQLAAKTDKVTTLEASLEEAERSKDDLFHQLETSRKSKSDLSRELSKTREVMDQLDAEEDRELEEAKERENQLQLENDKLHYEIEELNVMLQGKERELAQREADEGEELREARQALIALDKERSSPSRERDDGNHEKVKALNDQLALCKEQIHTSQNKLNHTIREKELIISDLKSELSSKEKYSEDLKDELESLQLSVERGPSKRNYGMSIDPEWHEPDTLSKLKVQVSTLSKEKRMVESELRAKIDARDATIATLVLSSSNQEANVVKLKSEVSHLQALVDSKSSSESYASGQWREHDAKRCTEVERLRERTYDLSIELKQTKRKLLSVTDDLDCARSQLAEYNAMPDVQDLAGRLVVSEQVQKMLKTENSDKLKERDAAIANLLQSMQANEGVIANLRAEVDIFKSKLKESTEENRRLQHESEIFATQIIDQDEEFESLNAQLKDKSSEISSLKKDIAAGSAQVRSVKNLERQLGELREEKRHNMGRINKLEIELRDAELKKAEEDGFEMERLKIELKDAIDAKQSTEERLNKQIDSIRKLRNHAMEDFESKLRQRDNLIASLEKELLQLKEKVLDDDFDDIFLDEKPGGGGQSKMQLIEERDMLLVKVEALGEEIKTLRASRDSSQLSELKTKLAQSERLREELEKDCSTFNSSKDKEMDRLRMQLSESREAQSDREFEQLSLLKKLEAENNEIRQEFNIRMSEKNAKIVALEQTLAAQEQVVSNMSSEMDQLQNGMEKVSVQRRAEIEEMQQELMDCTSKGTRLEREVSALSMKLDEKKMKHKTEVAKLKDRIATLESEAPLERNVRRDNHDDRRRETELEEKNDHLKWLTSSLKDDNEKLKEKVDRLKKAASKAKKDEGLPPKSAKNNDKWRAIALQEQVAVLSTRVIELEEAAAAASVSAAQTRRPPHSPMPSILHSPGMLSSLEKSSVNTTRPSSAPKSVLRVSTYEHDANQTNDLVSNSDNEQPWQTQALDTPPPLPRPTPGSNTPKSLEKSKGGSSKSTPRFNFRKKSSKDRNTPLKSDDASNSTTNYDF